MRRSVQNFNIRLGNLRAFELLKIRLLKFPALGPKSRSYALPLVAPRPLLEDKFSINQSINHAFQTEILMTTSKTTLKPLSAWALILPDQKTNQKKSSVQISHFGQILHSPGKATSFPGSLLFTPWDVKRRDLGNEVAGTVHGRMPEVYLG